MKPQIFHKFISILAIFSIGLLSAYAIAGQDVSQQQMMQSVMQSRQMMQQAEGATGAERQELMNRHLAMMQEIMGKMQGMQPGAGMTNSEMQAWFNEHLKLMTEIMGQMMQEQHMMMDMRNMPMGAAGGMGGGMGGMNTK